MAVFRAFEDRPFFLLWLFSVPVLGAGEDTFYVTRVGGTGPLDLWTDFSDQSGTVPASIPSGDASTPSGRSSLGSFTCAHPRVCAASCPLAISPTPVAPCHVLQSLSQNTSLFLSLSSAVSTPTKLQTPLCFLIFYHCSFQF